MKYELGDTFKRRLQDGGGLERKEKLLGVFAESAALIGGNNQLADEAGTISDVIVLIIFRQVQYILRQQFSLKDGKAKENVFCLKSFMPDRQCYMCVSK